MYLLVWLLGPDRFLSPLPSSRVQASGNSFSSISTLDLLVLAMFYVCQRWSSQAASGSHFKHSTDRFKHKFVHKPPLHPVSCYTCTPSSINIHSEATTQDTAQSTNFKLNSTFLHTNSEQLYWQIWHVDVSPRSQYLIHILGDTNYSNTDNMPLHASNETRDTSHGHMWILLFSTSHGIGMV